MNHTESRREKIARRLPVALQTCPFECFMAMLSTLLGIVIVVGAIEPSSLLNALPHGGLVVWGIGLLAGGVTLISGLPRRTNPPILAAGLSLTGTLLGAYAVAVIGYAGWQVGGLSGIFFAVVALLCGFRAFYLRAQTAATERVQETGHV